MKLFFRKNRIPIGFISALVLLTLAATYKSKGGSDTSGVAKIGVVARGDLIQKITVAGTLIPKRRTAIMPPYTGYVRKLYAKIGEKIKAGDPVVTMSQTLVDSPSQSFPIRAPFSGTVVQVLHMDGEYVQTGQDTSMLVRIDDVSTLYVMADVPELDILKIKLGQDVIVRASPVLDKSYKGVIREISLAAREKKEWSRASDKVDFPVKVEIMDADESVKPGMSALIDIIANKRSGVLKLRHEYIEKNAEDYSVTLEGGTKKPIKVGLQNEESFEILEGLKEGERVRLTDFMALQQVQD